MGFDYITITSTQWDKFFHLISTAHSISNACVQAKIERTLAYRLRKEFKHIDERWNDAILAGKEYLEDTARKRAVDGVARDKSIYYKGELVVERTEIEYSDAMLALLLRGRMPMYRDHPQTRVDVAVAKELTRVFDILRGALSSDEYKRVIELIAADDLPIAE